jgi:hypothetical protein
MGVLPPGGTLLTSMNTFFKKPVHFFHSKNMMSISGMNTHSVKAFGVGEQVILY